MARNRSSILIAVGVAVFVLGSSMAFLLVHDNKKGTPAKVQTASQTASLPAHTNLAAASPTAAATSIDIPDGMEALAVQLPFVPGVAGYVHNGDNINIYGVFKAEQPTGGPKAPLSKLVLSNVKVLSVTSPVAGSDNGAATYLLALTSAQAEQMVYMSSFQSLYMSLARKGAPAASTSGHNITNAL